MGSAYSALSLRLRFNPSAWSPLISWRSWQEGTLGKPILLRDMRLRYSLASDVKGLFDHIALSLQFDHIPLERVFCFRSFGSKSQGVIARVHALPKIWQFALDESSYYAIEVVSERFDPLPNGEKERVLIHEALHIPKAFGGGFRPHKGWISKKRVDALHRELSDRRRIVDQSNGYLSR